MKTNTDFIQHLQERKSKFPSPEEAIDKANACNLISKDIYTDNTRFIYELLQNADDASYKNNQLTFRIDYVGDYLIVSHQGKPFTEDDIESICSIGDGTKASDSEQTGFKGIGFKSVFAYSKCVIIKSGDYCFKFDQEESTKWDAKWGNQVEWIKMRENKGKDMRIKMPWQIIPINTVLPQNVANKLKSFGKDYTVSTIIRCRDIEKFKSAISKLFSETQIILFLRSREVHISIAGEEPLIIAKSVNTKGVTYITKNGETVSSWLIHTTKPFDVPNELRNKMEEDSDHYPEKLRNAKKASISFAIALDKNGRINKIADTQNNIFAFLPTTINDYTFPFIVNANFITDAGRQNLHQDYVWNQWLFEEMPKHYIKWMAEIAKKGNYGLDFLKVISLKAGSYDTLSQCYNKGMEHAIETIAFLPNGGNLIRITDAIYDDSQIFSSCLSPELLISYLQANNKYYKKSNILSTDYATYIKQLNALSVYIFDNNELDDFLKSKIFSTSHSLSENATLITYLSKKYPLHTATEEDNLNDIYWLKDLPFVYSENNALRCPYQLCLPSTQYVSELRGSYETISNTVFKKLSSKSINWLKYLGLSEPSDTSLIDTGKLFEDGFITKDNIIDITHYIFRLHKKAKLDDAEYRKLRELKVLTQECSIKAAVGLFLSNRYIPEVQLEGNLSEDIFVSDKYIVDGDSASEWKVFWEKIGVASNLTWTNFTIPANDVSSNSKIFSEYADELFSLSKEFKWESYKGWSDMGWSFYPSYAFFSGYPYLNLTTNFNFSKTFWNHIINSTSANKILQSKDCYVKGATGFIERNLNASDLKSKNFNTNYFNWCLQNHPIIPTTDGTCHYAKDVYSNAIPDIKDLCGNYIPIIDYPDALDNVWETILGLKTQLGINELLEVLSIIQDSSTITDEDKNRIETIYAELIRILPTLSRDKRNTISKWAQQHKLLAKDNTFYLASELSYITQSGFNSEKIIYTGSNGANIVDLLKLFGVEIIDSNSIKTNIADSSHCDAFKECLLEKAPLLAILSLKDRTYPNEIEKIRKRLEELSICQAKSIVLSYGNHEQTRSCFYDEKQNKFFFTGDWEKSRVRIGIVETLSDILHIKHSYNNILSVILTEDDFTENKKYLEEEGFDISQISDEFTPKHVQTFKKLTAREEVELIESNINDCDNFSEGISSITRVSFAVEAQNRIMEILSANKCSFDKQNHNYTVLYSIKLQDGTQRKAIMKSAKGGYLYFTPREWLELACDNAMLLLVDPNNQVRNVNITELEDCNDHFHMRFDTHVFAIKSNLKTFAKFFKPLPQNSVYFVFGVPFGVSKANYLEEFGLDKQNASALDLTKDDINMLL